MLHCTVDEVVLCPNVTTATNTVLHNIPWEAGDVIVYTSGVYAALEKTIDYIVESRGAESVKIDLELPQRDEVIVKLFRESVRAQKARCAKRGQGKVRMAVFDTIVSTPGLRLPFEEMIRVCRDEGVLSLVDGAHGIGHIDLNLSELDPDFLVSNCHKWLFVPRSVAAFFVPKRNQHLIRTTMPTSHGFQPKRTHQMLDFIPSDEPNPMIRQFEYFGTIDGAPYCCIEEAMRFRDEVCGGDLAIRTYCTSLAKEAEQILVETLGTETFDIPETHRVFFAHVRLPISVGEGDGYDMQAKDVPVVKKYVDRQFVEKYRTFMSVFPYRGEWWARLSVTVYHDLEDCKYAASVLKELCGKVREGLYR